MAKTPTRAQSGVQDAALNQEATTLENVAPVTDAIVSTQDNPETHARHDEIDLEIDPGFGYNPRKACEDGTGESSHRSVRKAVGHFLLPEGRRRAVHSGDLIITCQTPGFRRAGVDHPAFAVHDAGRFSPEQIALLRNERKLTVIQLG